jgi:hypothetical protein
MRGPALARKTVRIGVAVGTAVVAAAGAVWLGAAPSGPPRASGAGARVGGPSALVGASVADAPTSTASVPGGPLVPLSLTGSMPPRLPLDIGGRLATTRTVRDFFDYFLTAQHEVQGIALDTMVRREIAAQLDGTVAQMEALEVWRRYGAYRDAFARMAPLQTPQSPNAAGDGPNNVDRCNRRSMKARRLRSVRWAPRGARRFSAVNGDAGTTIWRACV